MVKEITERHRAWYGDILLERMFCKECDCMCLVIEDIKQCCLKKAMAEKSTEIEYVSEPVRKRKQLPLSVKKKILSEQGRRCFYCFRKFGSRYCRNNKIGYLKLHFDHINPYIMTYNNQPDNFVASCDVCNFIKSRLTIWTR